MADPKDAFIVCDDEPTTRLRIFFGGNLDWYMSIHDAQHPRLAPAIRFRTSGSSQPDGIGMAVAAMHAIAEGNGPVALARALALVETIRAEMKRTMLIRLTHL